MNLPSVLLPSHAEWPRTQRTLVTCAAIVAISVLVMYVDLLRVWMVRGDQMREAQRSFVVKPTLKRTDKPTPLALATPRKRPAVSAAHDE